MSEDSFDRADFPFQRVGEFSTRLIESIYHDRRFFPEISSAIPPIDTSGVSIEGLEEMFSQLVRESALLATPMSIGHMDTAGHPAGVFADALVSALNNNLLFRELSPFASRIEEYLLDFLQSSLGLVSDWRGVFVSGGSLANLTALFAACGGFNDVGSRRHVALFVPACVHGSIAKSAAVLGITADSIHCIDGDETGKADLDELERKLVKSRAARKIVVGVLGSTVHGSVEYVAGLADLCTRYDCWLHVDAVYGAALGFSSRYRYYLDALDRADSVTAGPQKWMYVPRLSAVTFIRGTDRFNETLRYALPYSILQEPHLGQWGLQGSRRADAVTLWAVLRCMGTDCLGVTVDRGITLAKEFHQLLLDSDSLEPTHVPDLNVQCFVSHRDVNMHELHELIGHGSVPWTGLSQWENRELFRSVLLAPELTLNDLEQLCSALSP